jgi:hypothetical protein
MPIEDTLIDDTDVTIVGDVSVAEPIEILGTVGISGSTTVNEGKDSS